MGVDLYLAYGTAVLMGLVHGSDPGHGWPLSALMASGRGGVRSAILYTSVLAVGHFLSTLAVVLVVWLLGSAAEEYLEAVTLVAGVALLVLGSVGLARALRGGHGHHHHHDHGRGPAESGLWGLFKYSLLLGFAHEEEVALAAIILLGAHPLLLALSYSLAVYASMVVWTLASLYVIRRRGLEDVLRSRVHLLSPVFLILVGVYILASHIV